MIIGVTGYGGTGASAYIDLIKEFEGVQSYDSAIEFQTIQETDGISDLKYNLVQSGHRLSTNAAIRRFLNNLDNPRINKLMQYSNGKYKELAREYAANLTQIAWIGRSNYDPIDLRPPYDRLSTRKFTKIINATLSRINEKWAWPPLRERYFSFLDEEEFNKYTGEFINGFFEACGFDTTKPILVEQIFNTRNPLEGAEYFDKIRSLVVERDPRDVFILTNYNLRRLSGYMPHDGNVETFVRYYRSLHSSKVIDPRVWYVQYEDLIFQYEETCTRLSEWLGIAQIKKGDYFKPEHSFNNAQMYLRHPDLKDKIKYIEDNLTDYLYDFDSVPSNLGYEPVIGDPFHIQKTK